MWWFYIFLLTVSQVVANDEEAGVIKTRDKRQDAETDFLKIADLQLSIKLKCEKHGKGHIFQDLQLMFMQLPQCYSFQSLAMSQNIYQSLCTDARNAFYNCIEKITTKLAECLEPEEKSLPEFILSSYNSTFEERCKKGIQIEQAPDFQCIPENSITRDHFAKCVPTNQLKINNKVGTAEYILTTDDICHDLTIVEECTINFFKTYCPTTYSFHDDLKLMFDTEKNVCKKFKNAGAHFVPSLDLLFAVVIAVYVILLL